MDEEEKLSKTEAKSHSLFSFLKKKQKKTESYSDSGDYDKPEDEDEELFENKNEEIKKYTLVSKFKHFILNKHEVVKVKEDDGAGFTKGLMDSDDNSESESVITDNFEVKEKNIFLKLRWWDWIVIVIELSLVIYTILVFMGIAPIF